MYLRDGATHLLIDPCFTRPKLLSLARRIAPDQITIRRCLERANITRLDAVLLSHTHYDHALDAVLTARETGALLVGTPSAARLAGGGGLPVESCLRVEEDRAFNFGAFRITFIQHKHLSLGGGGWLASGAIEKPLVPPAHAWTYREGGVYAIHCPHSGGRLLVVGSAGMVDFRKLKNLPAGSVCLGIGGLAFKMPAYRRNYFRGVVKSCGAQQVYLTHWDIFWRSLEREPVYLPLHRFVVRQFEGLAERQGKRLQCLQPWQETNI